MRRISIAVLVGVFFLAACSSHSSSSAASSATPSGTSSTTSSATASPAGSPSAAANAAGTFGDLANICGPGAATGATDTGITNTSIRVADVSDVGAKVAPGLNQAFWDSGTAFVDWCNAAGGILGRKLVLDKTDAALTNYLPEVEQMCPVDFSMVGGQSAGDDTGVSARVACGLPDIAPYIFGPKSVDSTLKAAAFPTPNNQVFLGGVHTFFTQQPDLKAAVGAVFPNGATGAEQQKIFTEGLKADGGTLVSVQQYAQGSQLNWSPIIDSMRQAGVKFLLIDADAGSTASLEQAMQTANWWPDVQVGAPHLYDDQFLKLMTIAPQNFYVYTPIAPLEEATTNSATAQYIKIVKQYVPAAQVGFPGVESFSAWLLFASAAKACGSTLTRTCLMQQISHVDSWTGGGLTSTADPAQNTMPECYAVLKITGTSGNLTYTRDEPATGFDCSPDNAPSIQP